MPLNPNACVTQLRRVFNNMSGAEPPPSDARFEAGDRWNGQGGMDSCRGKSGEAVLFLIHGGGYIFAAPRTHRTRCQHLRGEKPEGFLDRLPAVRQSTRLRQPSKTA
jgi:hypothetical protein